MVILTETFQKLHGATETDYSQNPKTSIRKILHRSKNVPWDYSIPRIEFFKDSCSDGFYLITIKFTVTYVFRSLYEKQSQLH